MSDSELAFPEIRGGIGIAHIRFLLVSEPESQETQHSGPNRQSSQGCRRGGRLLPLPPGSSFLFGPRGTGRTTWLRSVLPDASWSISRSRMSTGDSPRGRSRCANWCGERPGFANLRLPRGRAGSRPPGHGHHPGGAEHQLLLHRQAPRARLRHGGALRDDRPPAGRLAEPGRRTGGDPGAPRRLRDRNLPGRQLRCADGRLVPDLLDRLVAGGARLRPFSNDIMSRRGRRPSRSFRKPTTTTRTGRCTTIGDPSRRSRALGSTRPSRGTQGFAFGDARPSSIT